MRIYRIEVEQQIPGNTFGVNSPWAREIFDVKARTAWEAMRRVRKMVRGNGFMKTYPLDVVRVVMLSGQVK